MKAIERKTFDRTYGFARKVSEIDGRVWVGGRTMMTKSISPFVHHPGLEIWANL
jgi:hypothetical protein